MITILERSSPSAVERYRRELLESNVSPLAQIAVTWTEVQVTAPTGLRLLKTFWCELRGMRRPGGGPFFLHEVVAAIEVNEFPDPDIATTVSDARWVGI